MCIRDSSKVKKIVNDLEPDVAVKELSLDMSRSAYVLNGQEVIGGSVISNENHGEELSEKHGDISKEDKIKFIVGSMFFISAFIVKDIEWLKVGLFLISYILVGGHVVMRAAKNILKGQVFDEKDVYKRQE